MKKLRTEQVTLIFSALAGIGVIATGVLAAIRAPKYKEILEETESKPKAFFGAHWPGIVAGLATELCIFAAQKIGAEAIVGLTATAGYLATHRDLILDKVREYGGEDLLEKVQKDATREYVATNIPMRMTSQSIEETGYGDTLCYESYSGRWFRSSDVAVASGIDKFKKRWGNGEDLSFNDLYHELGIAMSQFGYEHGYPNHKDYYDGELDIEPMTLEGWSPYTDGRPTIDEPVIVITVYTPPMDCWMEV